MRWTHACMYLLQAIDCILERGGVQQSYFLLPHKANTSRLGEKKSKPLTFAVSFFWTNVCGLARAGVHLTGRLVDVSIRRISRSFEQSQNGLIVIWSWIIRLCNECLLRKQMPTFHLTVVCTLYDQTWLVRRFFHHVKLQFQHIFGAK